MARLFVVLTILATSLRAQQDSVTITEVMFDPIGSENTDEYVEIYNFSKTQTYDISNWIISDSAGGNDSDKVISFGEGTLLYPGQYAVILDPDYANAYASLIPDTARVVAISGTTFGSGGFNNSSSEVVMFIKTSPRDTLSVYRYSLGNSPGFSDEKILSTSDNSSSNWTNSYFVNGTPGAPPSLDLSVQSLAFNPIAPPSGTSTQVTAVIKNIGIRYADSFRVFFYMDSNRNSVADPPEVFDSADVSTPLARLDSVSVQKSTPILSLGTHHMIVRLQNVLPDGDTIAANNQRIDSVTTVPQYDLSISQRPLRFVPSVPAAGSTVQIHAVVVNAGQSAITGAIVRFYRDANEDSIAEPAEVIDSVSLGSILAAGDSTTLSISVSSGAAGSMRYFADISPGSVLPSSDEQSNNNLRGDRLLVGVAPGSIIIDEMMVSPLSGGTEWIELLNASTDTIDLRKWQLADGNADQTGFASKRTLTTSSLTLAPGELIVVGKDSVAFFARYPSFTGSRLFFSSFPSLNNSGDIIGIFDSLGLVSDSLLYTDDWGGGTDVSLERRSSSGSSTDPANWSSSLSAMGATPGMVNSVSPVPFDVAITKIATIPEFPIFQQSFQLTVTVRNIGLNGSTAGFLRLFNDANRDSIADGTEIVDSASVVSLLPGDSATVPFQSVMTTLSGISFIAHVDVTPEDRPENNTAVLLVRSGIAAQSVVINEILYDPDTSQVEFVEIVNRSVSAVNLKDWTIGDASTSKILLTMDHWLPVGGYRVLSGSATAPLKLGIPDSVMILISSMPAFNNDTDGAILRDAVGLTVDSLTYSSTWGGGGGVSLERTSPDVPGTEAGNWNSSVGNRGMTPGRRNSLLDAIPFPGSAIIINEIMYSPLSGEPEYIEIYNPGDSAVDILSWSVFVGDDKNILARASRTIAPKGFAVISNATSLPSRFAMDASTLLKPPGGLSALSNEGTTLVLRDPTGKAIDSVAYLPSWGGGEGIALEKLSPSGDGSMRANWSSCVFVEGGTPGRTNSVFSDRTVSKIKIQASPNPFLVDRNEVTQIRIDIPVPLSRLTVRVYDHQGRLIQTLLNNSPSGAHREITWDGKTKNGQWARMGIYVLYVEAISEQDDFHKSAKATVVVGRKL